MGFWDRIFGEDPEKIRREREAAIQPQVQPRTHQQDRRAYDDPYGFTRDRMFSQARDSAGRTGVQAQTREQQLALVRALQETAAGYGPSAARTQLSQTTDRNVALANALAQSQRGTNPALAQRMAMNQAAQMNQEAAGQAATLRAQEALGAQSQLGSVLSGVRGQDLESQAINDQMVRFFEQAGLTKEQAQFQANIMREQDRARQLQEQQALAVALEQQRIAAAGGMSGPAPGFLPQIAGGVASGAGSAMAMGATG